MVSPVSQTQSADFKSVPSENVSQQWKIPAGVVFVVPFLLGLLFFLPALRYDFVYDDLIEIPAYDGLFAPGAWPEFFVRQQSEVYRPIKYVLFHVVGRVWGWNPAYFHLSGVLFHALAAGLIAMATIGLGFSRAAAVLGAAWFAVHPIHIEPVVWISAHAGVVSACGAIAAFALFIEYVRRGSTKLLWMIPVSAAFGYWSREDAVAVIPVAVAAYFILIRRNSDMVAGTEKRAALGLAALLLPAALYLIMRQYLIPGIAQVRTWEHGVWGLAATLPGIILRYAGQTLLPLGMTLEPPLRYTFQPVWLYGIKVMAAVAVLALCVLPRLPAIVRFSAVWWITFLLPALGIIPINAPVADRYLYLSSAAGTFIIAFGWDSIVQRGPAQLRYYIGAIAALIFVYGFIAFRYRPIWHNDTTLWNYVIRRNPASHRAWNNLAVIRNRAGDFPEALKLVDKALLFRPNYREALITKAFALSKTGRLQEAESLYLGLLRTHPTDTQVMYLLADVKEQRNDTAGAEKVYGEIFRIRPGFADARLAAGVLAIQMNKPDEAIRHWKTALKYDPSNQMARHNLQIAERQTTSSR